jgi:hypothetical protein
LAVVVWGCRQPERSSAPPAIGAAPEPARPIAERLQLPNTPGAVRFAVIGDSGRGDPPQYQVSAQMQAFRAVFPFDFVVMAGDNVYDGGTAIDYRDKFELPYKPLLDAGVQFFAAIGNHDDYRQPYYPPFHMGGKRYYWFKPPSLVARVFGADVAFFMLDTENLDLSQRAWIDREMTASSAAWKIPVFHRPIYTSGRYDLGARQLRSALEPLFRRHGVTVVFSGHEHFYERTVPLYGITYFISGGAGSLRYGDIRPTSFAAAGFDRDYHFMLVEIDGDTLSYQAISRTGATIDAGTVQRRQTVTAPDTEPPKIGPRPAP